MWKYRTGRLLRMYLKLYTGYMGELLQGYTDLHPTTMMYSLQDEILHRFGKPRGIKLLHSMHKVCFRQGA